MTTVPLVATLTAPLHHGAGTSGNTSLLRTQDTVTPDGRHVSVPFVSGNSLRNRLRTALAWHLVETVGVPDQGLTKHVVDLLWSGGSITSTGAQTDLELAREVSRMLPQLRLLGYSAGSEMVAGTVYVDHLHLVCAENTWRLPPELARSPHAGKHAAAYRAEEFGTRHDIAGTPAARYIQIAAGTLDDPAVHHLSTQMIYDMQTLKPGSVLSGSLHVTPAATDEQRKVLAAAVDLAAPASDGVRIIRLGAKGAVGMGAARLDVDLSPLDPDGGALSWWTDHLAGHADGIVDLLGRVAA